MLFCTKKNTENQRRLFLPLDKLPRRGDRGIVFFELRNADDPENAKRPAYRTDPTNGSMATVFTETTEELLNRITNA